MNKDISILAIYPTSFELQGFDYMPPLGMAWIASVIREHGYDVHLLDQQVDKRNIQQFTEEIKPTMVFIGGTSHSRFNAFDIARKIKEVNESIYVVYGGPHASFTAKETLEYIKDIDIIVHGEGEYISLDLLSWKKARGTITQLYSLKGISFRHDGRIISTGWRPSIRDLDLLPNPARDLLPMEKYNSRLEYLQLPATSIITARGCPIGCSYCSASRMFPDHYAYRSANFIVDEIENLMDKYSIRGFKIFDSTFTLNSRHVTSFCNELLNRKLVIPWECEVRVGSVNQELLELMKKAGCYYLDVGIESGHQDVLNSMGKKIFVSQSEEFLKTAQKVGLLVKAFFSIGHIGETYRKGKESIKFIYRNKKRIKLVILNPGLRIYPGTKLEEYANSNSLFPEGFNWSKPFENTVNKKLFLPVHSIPILIQPQMGIKEIRRLRILYFLSMISLKRILFRFKYHHDYGQLKRYVSTLIKSLLSS